MEDQEVRSTKKVETRLLTERGPGDWLATVNSALYPTIHTQDYSVIVFGVGQRHGLAPHFSQLLTSSPRIVRWHFVIVAGNT